jgi:hypothetical protein
VQQHLSVDVFDSEFRNHVQTGPLLEFVVRFRHPGHDPVRENRRFRRQE